MPRAVVVSTLSSEPVVRELQLAEGATVADAVRASGLVSSAPDGSFKNIIIGVFSNVVSHATLVREGDRIEIYRPLEKCAREARRLRLRRKAARPGSPRVG